MDLSAFNLQGKVALITGGAHGIGFSIAEGMAKCGAAICFNCSSEASLEKGLAAYKAAGIDAHGYVADVFVVFAMTDKTRGTKGISAFIIEKGFKGFNMDHPIAPKLVPMLKEKHPEILEGDGIKWNFTKFLIDREGNVVERFEPTTTPEEIAPAIEKLL